MSNLLRRSSLFFPVFLLAYTVPGKTGGWFSGKIKWSNHVQVNGQEVYHNSGERDISGDDVVAAAKVVGRAAKAVAYVSTFPFRCAWKGASWAFRLADPMRIALEAMEAEGHWTLHDDGSWTCVLPATCWEFSAGKLVGKRSAKAQQGSTRAPLQLGGATYVPPSRLPKSSAAVFTDPFAGYDFTSTPFQSVAWEKDIQGFRVVLNAKQANKNDFQVVKSFPLPKSTVGGASPTPQIGGPTDPSSDAGLVNSAPARVTAEPTSDDSTNNTEPAGGGGVPTWVYVVVTVSGLVMLILAALFIVLVCRRPRASPSEDIENSAHSYDDF